MRALRRVLPIGAPPPSLSSLCAPSEGRLKIPNPFWVDERKTQASKGSLFCLG